MYAIRSYYEEVPATGHVHREARIRDVNRRVGNLTHFVEVDRVVLVAEYLVHLLLVPESAYPDLRAVPQPDVVVVNHEPVSAVPDNLVKPGHQRLVKYRAPRVLRAKAANQVPASPVPHRPVNNRDHEDRRFTAPRPAEKKHVFRACFQKPQGRALNPRRVEYLARFFYGSNIA